MMISLRSMWCGATCVLVLFCFCGCQKNSLPQNGSKIQFDTADINSSGLRNGEAHVDYEFCIPAEQSFLDKILSIEPNAKVMKSSRGRVGCNAEQWLCIVSTSGPGWDDKLYRIAKLSFVERIIETHYE